jgi:starvation-inducible DNA-binding protein
MISLNNKLSATDKTRTRMPTTSDCALAYDDATLAHALGADLPDPHALHTAFGQLLADTITLRDLYAKHAAQASGPNARVFELICQRHHAEHARLVVLLSEQLLRLGGDPLVMARDIALWSSIPCPPRRAESMSMQVQRLLNAHEAIAVQAISLLTAPQSVAGKSPAASETVLVASELTLTGKLHVWLLGEHLRNLSSASQTVSHPASITGRLVLPFC